MGLQPFVLLFTYCFLGSAVQGITEKADCDDPTVFQAADKVLRSLNDAKEDGNQFILYRITEATKKEESGRVQVFIMFEIQESVCQVKNGIDWQRCAFKVNEADFGECSAHVLVNTETKSDEIIRQNCSTEKGWKLSTPKQPVVEPTVTVVRPPCLGCYQAVDTNSELLLPMIQSAIEKMNTEGNHKFHFGLQNITKAEQQVVSGWNYRLVYEIQQTNCSKTLFPKWIPEICTLEKNGQQGQCVTDVFVTPNEEIKDILLSCYSSTGFCLNCPGHIEKNDPELLNLLEQIIAEYNSQSNHTHLYKIENIQLATRKLVQNEKQYHVKFIIQETNCSQSNHSILGDECEAMGDNLICEANINVTDKTEKIIPDYRCDPIFALQQMASRIVVKGLSPLRMMPLVKTEIRFSRSADKLKRKGIETHHKDQQHGKEPLKKDNKDKGDKKHNGKHDHSSEESAEEYRHKPHVQPRPPHVPPRPPHLIPRVPEVDTSVLMAPTQQAKPANADKIDDIQLPQLPSLLEPDLSHSSPPTSAVPDQQGTYPNIHETVILELPALVPEDVPKCPGKLWKPLLPILQIATEKPFIIGGLTFHDDDLLPENEKQLLLPDTLPDTPGILSDSDLIS